MKKITKEDYERMRGWIYRYGVHIQIAKFQFFLENGSQDEVVKALSFYQNPDGGFISFDFDNWNQNSSPVALFYAYYILKDIGITDKNHPMIQGMIKYMENCEYCTDKGCFWSIPSNNHYPCQPYYLYPTAPWHAKDWPAENYVNNSYVEFVLKYFDKNSPMYHKILQVIEYRISFLPRLKEFYGFTGEIEQGMESYDWLTLIRTIRQYGIKSYEECEILEKELLELTKTYANPSVYEELLKNRRKIDLEERGEVIPDAILDEMVESVCHNQDWCKEALVCENPEKRFQEISQISSIAWPIEELVNKLIQLKKYDRIEE